MEGVRKLLGDPRIDPTRHHHLALDLACDKNYEDIALMLLQDPRVDSNCCNKNSPLKYALENKNAILVSELMKDSRVNPLHISVALVWEMPHLVDFITSAGPIDEDTTSPVDNTV
jgi:hypothetical protein